MQLEDIHSNHKNVCVDCGEEITTDNDSKWQVFTDSRTTQKICVMCDLLRQSMLVGMKVSDIDRSVLEG